MLSLLAACSQPDVRPAVVPQIVDEDAEPKSFEISRSEYEETVQAGMQTVLRWVFVKPAYGASGKFLGYQVVEIYKLELKEGPLKVGDVLMSVNDLPIERPEQAMLVWRGLWGRKNLKLTFQRDGKQKTMTIPVVEDPVKNPNDPKSP